MRLRSIGFRTLAFFLLATLLPVALLSAYLLTAQQNDRKQEAADRQSLLVSTSAERVDNFLGNKIDSLILHSQTTSVLQFETAQADQELTAYIKQDQNILKISLVDSKGNEKVVADRNGLVKKLGNVASTDAFRVATFLSGKEYIGPVHFASDGTPMITLAVPLVNFVNRQDSTNLSTAESGIIRSAADIKGALISEISLDTLWTSVLSQRLGQDGYAYVVDDKGNLIAHPDTKFVGKHPDLSHTTEVADSLTSPSANKPRVTVSEKGVQVLSSHYPVSRSGWVVIGEEPTNSVYGPLRQATRVSLLFGVLALLIGVALSVVMSRSLVRPIQALAEGVSRIGRGELSYKLNMPRRDELGVLAQTVNDMGGRLSTTIGEYQKQNLILGAEQSKLSAVLNTMTDGVVALDAGGNIVFSNQISAQLAAIKSETLNGMHWTKAFPLEVNNQPVNLPKLNDTQEAEMLVSGKAKYVRVAAVALHNDPSGMATIVTLHDITPSRELENMKLDFVSIAAHELRTPLTTIRGYLERLGDSKKNNAEDTELIEHAASGAQTLASLISNLLSVSKLENRRFNLAHEPLDWLKLVNEVVKDESIVAAESKITIVGPNNSEPLWVSGDIVALKEVLGNLIANAINFSSANKKIVVSVQTTDGEIVTSVVDHGMGIAKEAQTRLFEKFYQATGGLARTSKGTGLGLYISKSIIELHGGKIWVESDEGKGSTFSFSLQQIAQPQIKSGAHKAGAWGWMAKR